MLRSWSIVRKIASGFGLLILLIIAVSLTGWSSLSSIRDALEQADAVNGTASRIAELTAKLGQEKAAVEEAMLLGDPKVGERMASVLADGRADSLELGNCRILYPHIGHRLHGRMVRIGKVD